MRFGRCTHRDDDGRCTSLASLTFNGKALCVRHYTLVLRGLRQVWDGALGILEGK